jgi:hypothetical protein
LKFSRRHGGKGSPTIWLIDALRNAGYKSDVNYNENLIVAKASRSGLCAACKGSKLLCGKKRCPILVKVNYFLKSVPLMQSQDIAGASPPSVFVGGIGYPYVYAGPLVPPVQEDTSLYDLPEFWFEKQ